MILRSPLVAGIALASLSGCALLDMDSCIYELRGVTVTGQRVQPDPDSLVLRLTESEQRDSDPSKNMYWGFQGSAAFKPHVLGAQLRDVTQPASVRFTFPLSPPDRPTIAEGATSMREGANLNGFFDLLASGHAVIEFSTNLSDQPTISIPLVVERKDDWYRPHCG